MTDGLFGPDPFGQPQGGAPDGDLDPVELQRDVARTLLGAIAAAHRGDAEASDAAFEAVTTSGAVQVEVDEENGELQMDLSGLLGGACLLADVLVQTLAESTETETSEVVTHISEVLASLDLE